MGKAHNGMVFKGAGHPKAFLNKLNWILPTCEYHPSPSLPAQLPLEDTSFDAAGCRSITSLFHADKYSQFPQEAAQGSAGGAGQDGTMLLLPPQCTDPAASSRAVENMGLPFPGQPTTGRVQPYYYPALRSPRHPQQLWPSQSLTSSKDPHFLLLGHSCRCKKLLTAAR